MKVQRIVSNITASNPNEAQAFYQDILGLELSMDHGWRKTYGNYTKMAVQISTASEGGAGTPVADFSIAVDVLLSRVGKAERTIEYAPVSGPWGVRRFFITDPFAT